MVNMADTWSERLRSYLGRSCQQVETVEESQNEIQGIKEVRCGRRKGMDMCQYAEWKLVL